MDRISALRNIEEALSAFESGEESLGATERRVTTILRTYATEFETDEGLASYRASGDDPADGVVVVAASPAAARERVVELLAEAGVEADPRFDVERLE
jgi:hypothetical protein